MKNTSKLLGIIFITVIIALTTIGCPNGTTGFTVTFVYVSQGGSETTTITGVSYGATIPKPDDPTREGFLFGGWYTDAEWTNAWDFETDIVTSNIFLYTKWIDPSFVTYTVTFDSLGGSSVAPRMNINPGAKIIKPNDPTRNGYTFDGWYREAAFTNAWNFETDIVIGNIWLYAKWTPVVSNPESFLGLIINKTYFDVLNSNGSAFNETLIFTHAVINIGYSNIPVSLLEFGNGSIANVNNGEFSLILGTPSSSQLMDLSDFSTLLGFEITGDVKFCFITGFVAINGVLPYSHRIQWENVLYSNDFIALVYFDRDGTATGSGDIGGTFVTSDWEFKQGWNTVIVTTTGNVMTQVTAAPDLDIFKWITIQQGPGPSPSGFTVTFVNVLSGGSETTTITGVSYGATIVKPADPTREGFIFGGWYTDAAYTNAWNFVTDIITSNITLYAKWTPIISNPESFLGLTINKTYSDVLDRFGNALNETLTFTHAVIDNVGGSPTSVSLLEFGNGSIANVSNGEFSLILGMPPSSQLMNFPDYSTLGFEITDDVKFCVITDFVTLDGDRIRWMKNDTSGDTIMLMYFDRDGIAKGSGDNNGRFVTVDLECKQGWNTVIVTATGNVITQVTAAPDLDIFKWMMFSPSGPEATVTFNSLGGSETTTITGVSYGAIIPKPADPTRNGYTFGGWYREAACTNAWNFETDIVIGNIWLYAKWTPVVSNPESFLGLTVNETYSNVLGGFGGSFNETLTLTFTHAVIGTSDFSNTSVSLSEFGNGSIANVNNGEFYLTLGTPPSSQLMDLSVLLTGYEITDDVKSCLILFFENSDGIQSYNRIQWRKNDMNSSDHILLVYFDRDGTAKGSGGMGVIDWEFKQGWNTVIYTLSGDVTSWVTAAPDLDIFKWIAIAQGR